MTGHHSQFNRFLLSFFLGSLLVVFPSLGQAADEPLPPARRHVIHSVFLNEDRTVSVNLPPSYGSTDDPFPVLIVLDGEDFGPAVAGMVYYYARIGKCPEFIVAGIDSRDRWRDYTPTKAGIPDGTPLPTSGGSDNFLHFLQDELFPFLRENYRLSPFHILFGHSLAGLFVMNTLLKDDSSFSGYIATSPSLWWDNEWITGKWAHRAGRSFQHPRYLYFTMGNEGSTMLEPALRLEKILPGTDSNLSWKFERYEKTDHQTMPLKAFPPGLEYLCSDWVLPEKLPEEGLDSIVQYYKHLSYKYMQNLSPPERLINHLGYAALNQGRLEEAIGYFLYNLGLYPHSANVYDSLGEAYLKSGDREKALEYYKKSLELDPGNNRAKEIIRELEPG